MRFLRAERLHHFRERQFALALLDAKAQERRAQTVVESAEQQALALLRYRGERLQPGTVNIAALHELVLIDVALLCLRDVADQEHLERQSATRQTATLNAEQKNKLKHLQERIRTDAQAHARGVELSSIQAITDLNASQQGRL
jgi:hypothetical protein